MATNSTNAKKRTSIVNRRAIEKELNAFFSVNNSAAPTPDAGEVVRSGIITWGEDNDFPQKLLRLYDSSPTLQSIIEGTADYISGNGLTEIAPEIEYFAKRVNDDGNDLYDIVDLVGWNTETFGGAFILVARTLDKQHVCGLLVLDARRVRIKADGTGIRYYYMKNGELTAKFEEYQFFTGLGADYDTAAVEEVYFWRGRRPRGVYSRPRYAAALRAIDTQIRIQDYFANLVENNFTVCGILTVPSDGLTPDQQKELRDNINKTYSGHRVAGRLMVQFVSNKDLAAQYTSVSANDLDKQYTEVAKSTRENIYAAFRAIPALFGIMTETTGFSQQEFLDAFNLYNLTVIAPRQKDIVRIFSEIFDIERPFQILPFNFKDSTTDAA